MFSCRGIVSDKVWRVISRIQPLLVFGYLTPVIHTMDGKLQTVICLRLNPRASKRRGAILLIEADKIRHLFCTSKGHLENLRSVNIFSNEIAVTTFLRPWLMSKKNRNANKLTLALGGKALNDFSFIILPASIPEALAPPACHQMFPCKSNCQLCFCRK